MHVTRCARPVASSLSHCFRIDQAPEPFAQVEGYTYELRLLDLGTFTLFAPVAYQSGVLLFGTTFEVDPNTTLIWRPPMSLGKKLAAASLFSPLFSSVSLT